MNIFPKWTNQDKDRLSQCEADIVVLRAELKRRDNYELDLLTAVESSFNLVEMARKEMMELLKKYETDQAVLERANNILKGFDAIKELFGTERKKP